MISLLIVELRTRYMLIYSNGGGFWTPSSQDLWFYTHILGVAR